MKKNKSTFVKLLKRIKKHSFFIILSLIMAAVTVATTLYVPILVGRGIDCIIGVNNVDFAKIVNILIRIGIFVGITALSQWLMNICNNRITYEVTRDIRNEAIEKIQVLPLKYIDGHSYGEIVSRVIADVDQFADGLLMGFTQFFTGVMTILGTLIFMITINAKITLAVVVITPLSFLVASFIAKKTFSMFKLQSETRGEQTALIDEMIGGQKVVKAYGYEDEAVRKFDEINERLQKYSLKAIFFSSITNPSTRFVNSLVYASVAIVGAFSAINGGITVGQLSSHLTRYQALSLSFRTHLPAQPEYLNLLKKNLKFLTPQTLRLSRRLTEQLTLMMCASLMCQIRSLLRASIFMSRRDRELRL